MKMLLMSNNKQRGIFNCSPFFSQLDHLKFQLLPQKDHTVSPVTLTLCPGFQLMKIMVKVSDISNEARPMAVAEPWLDCLLQEFFNQVFFLLSWFTDSHMESMEMYMLWRFQCVNQALSKGLQCVSKVE